MLDAASLIVSGFSQASAGAGEAAIAVGPERQRYVKMTAATHFMRRNMDNKPATEKPDGAPILEIDECGENAGVAASLGDEMAERFGPRDEAPFAIIARDASGARIGGLNGVTHWRWLYVRNLWVAPEHRCLGLGARLMQAAENLARKRNCVGLYVDTFEPRAAAFYQRCGYTAAGRIENFPPGAARMCFSKKI